MIELEKRLRSANCQVIIHCSILSLNDFHHVKHSSQIHLQYKKTATAARCLVMRSEQLFFEIRNTWLRGHFVEFLLPETCKASSHTHRCCQMWKIHINWPLQLKQWQEVFWIHQINSFPSLMSFFVMVWCSTSGEGRTIDSSRWDWERSRSWPGIAGHARYSKPLGTVKY